MDAIAPVNQDKKVKANSPSSLKTRNNSVIRKKQDGYQGIRNYIQRINETNRKLQKIDQ